MRAWFAVAGIAAVAVELGLGVVALVNLGPSRIALYPVACAIASAAVTVALWRLLGRGPGGPGRGDGRGGESRDPQPPWWPQFERDLDEYSRKRARALAQPR